MSVDVSRYLSMFVGESTDHLDALSRDLVRLEQQPPDALKDFIDGLFRHAHSLKGMSAAMGFESTAVLAHRLEDLLSAIREEPKRLNKAVVDLALQAIDALALEVKAAEESLPFPDSKPLLQVLGEKITGLTGQQPVQTRFAEWATQETGLVPARTGNRLEVKAHVSNRSSTPGVRGFLFYKRLTTLGNVFDLRPSLEQIKAGKIPEGNLSVELETSSTADEVSKVLSTIADVELISVRALSAEAPVVPVVEAPKPVGQEPQRTVRVKTELLDQFLDLAGELLLATARVREMGRALTPAGRTGLDESIDALHSLGRVLHEKVMKARMTPLSVITDRLPRASRDIAAKRGREVELVISGAEIELDRATVDELNEPLLHLLRNAIDHGIESPEDRRRADKPLPAKVMVTVRRERDRVVLEVADDGRGMDPERLKAIAVERGLLTVEQAAGLSRGEALMLCCLPGVSTAGAVTDVSGRGVGMDAVKRAVDAAFGHLEISSVDGKGTTIRLHLPLTLAVVSLLLVGVGDEVLGLPITKVVAVVEERVERVATGQGEPLLSVNGSWVPVRNLGQLLELPRCPGQSVRPYVVVEADSGVVALEVDRLVGQEEVVLKSLHRPLDLVSGLSGVTILGSGRPVFVLDVPRLGELT